MIFVTASQPSRCRAGLQFSPHRRALQPGEVTREQLDQIIADPKLTVVAEDYAQEGPLHLAGLPAELVDQIFEQFEARAGSGAPETPADADSGTPGAAADAQNGASSNASSTQNGAVGDSGSASGPAATAAAAASTEGAKPEAKVPSGRKPRG